jgi:hypothetical protein
MQTVVQILLEHEIGFVSDAAVIGWAEAVMESGSELSFNSDLIALACLPANDRRRSEEAGLILRRLAETTAPGYDLSSKASEAHALSCFRAAVELLVAEKIRPYELCRLVQPIEQLFRFPEWLGNFYNECDWLEPETQPVEARHLYEYAEEYLRESTGATSAGRSGA